MKLQDIAAIAGIVIASLTLSGAVYTGIVWAADNRYIRQETFQFAIQQQRQIQLLEKKYDLEDKRDLGNGLTPLEERKLQRIIDELKEK